MEASYPQGVRGLVNHRGCIVESSVTFTTPKIRQNDHLHPYAHRHRRLKSRRTSYTIQSKVGVTPAYVSGISTGGDTWKHRIPRECVTW